MKTIEQKIREDFPSPILGVDVLEFLVYRRTYPADQELLEGYSFNEGDYYVSDFSNVYVYRPSILIFFPLSEDSPVYRNYRIIWAQAEWFEKNEFALLKRQERQEEIRRLHFTVPQKHAGGGQGKWFRRTLSPTIG
jgi:hypothetical protein